MSSEAKLLLEMRGIERTFGGERRFLAPRALTIHAVNGIDLELRQGDALGVVGESGCGKSTVARMLMGIIPPTAGTITFRGEDLTQLRGAHRRRIYRKIQFVFQDPQSSLNPRKTVREIIQAPMRHLLDLSPEQREQKARELMERVNLREEFLDRHPHEFSGGQAQRIGIARALAVDPEVLILDEPVSALDVSIQAQILQLLRRLKDELSLTYLFISHDLAVVDYLCERVVVMYLGKVVEHGSVKEIFETPRHPYTHVLLASVPEPGQQRPPRLELSGELPNPSDLPRGCNFAPRCYRAADRCRGEEPELLKYGPDDHHGAACFFADDPRPPVV
ncbi:MAG: oligopeptide/dipeptide ABC transporter ATP-binding protein [Alkalispirochaeta sp.]